AGGRHAISVNGSIHHRSMEASLTDQPIRILDTRGVLVRSIEFGAAGPLNTAETYWGGGIRNLWDVNPRFQVDLGLRIDGGGTADGVKPAPRAGVRYLVD